MAAWWLVHEQPRRRRRKVDEPKAIVGMWGSWNCVIGAVKTGA
jgi:hypothetical protein